MPALVSRKKFTIGAGVTATIDPGLSPVTDYSLIIVASLLPVEAWKQIRIDTDPSSTGVVVTNTGSAAVTVTAMFMYPHPIMGSQRSDSYLGATQFIAEPAVASSNFQFRLFAQASTSPSGEKLVNNLLANPSIRTGKFANVDLHCLTQDFNTSGIFWTTLVNTIAAAQTLTPPMAIYPGARVFATGVWSNWCDIGYWTTMANNFRLIAGLRINNDPRIAVDAENYLADSAEPTIDALIAHGFTLSQFRTAVQPFMDAMVEVGAVVCCYPQVVATSVNNLHQFIVSLLDALGPDRVEIFWEDSFGSSENYRLSPFLDWRSRNQLMRTDDSDYTHAYGKTKLIQRHVTDDDILRQWGTPLLNGPINSMGSYRPWIVDLTRADGNSVGTQAWIDGTALRSANDFQYAWAMQPLGGEVISCGVAATPITSEVWAGTNNIQTLTPSALVRNNILGIQLNVPPSPSTMLYTFLKLNNALPVNATDPWTMVIEALRIPAALAADAPLLSLAQTNAFSAQLAYLQASDKIVLQISAAGLQQYDVLAAPARDTDIKLVWGRSGTTWKYAANAVAPTSVVVPAQAAVIRNISLGCGQVPSTAPLNNSMAGLTNILFKGQVLVSHRLLTDVEITGQVQVGSYPYGRGT